MKKLFGHLQFCILECHIRDWICSINSGVVQRKNNILKAHGECMASRKYSELSGRLQSSQASSLNKYSFCVNICNIYNSTTHDMSIIQVFLNDLIF